MLRWFAAEAFTNAVTRQITGFTGGDSGAPHARIRQYVAEVLSRARRPAENATDRCPDPVMVRDSLINGIRPDNDPERDGFLLKRLDREVLAALETEAAQTDAQIVWLRSQIQQGRLLIVMMVACNDVPFSMVWGRTKRGKWLIVAFAVAEP